MDIEYTGERIIPDLTEEDPILSEHLIRYYFAGQFVKNKTVLDIACGSGYGSAILKKEGAAHVYGVDISKEATDYAKQRYGQDGIDFIQSDATNIPLDDNSIDILVSFETIEHVENYKAFMSEITRVLKPDGVLVLSTPIKDTSPDNNPFHIKEFSLAEFTKLMSKNFRYAKPLYQFNSFISVISDDQSFRKDEKSIPMTITNLSPLSNEDLVYCVMVCSNKPLKHDFKYKAATFRSIIFQKLAMELGLKESNILELGHKINAQDEQSKKLEKKTADLSATNKELQNKTADLSATNKELEELNAKLTNDIINITSSITWKLMRSVSRGTSLPAKSFTLLQQFASVLRTNGMIKGSKIAVDAVARKLSKNIVANDINSQYLVWFARNYPNRNILQSQKKKLLRMKNKPKISLLVPTYKTNITYFNEMVESVIAQSYENWELCIADDCSGDVELTKRIKSFAGSDKRIKYVLREENGHICAATNSALELATGDFVGLLDHDDILWPNALYEYVLKMQDERNIDLLYSDEDKLEFDGKTHVDPFMKPDWSPDYLRSINYITHFCVIRKSIVDEIRGFRQGAEGAQDWDVILRSTNLIMESFDGSLVELQKGKIVHVPKVLYSWRKSETSTASDNHPELVKSYAFVNQGKVLEFDLSQRKIEGTVSKTKALGLWEVKYTIKDNPLVSIVIPTKDKLRYVKRCIDSIYRLSTYPNFEIILVDTGSSEPEVFSYYEKLKNDHSNFFLHKWSEQFNFSSVCNYGAEKAKGKHLLFLNNDTEVITPDWIEGLLSFSQQDNIGAVGAKLLYPDGKIQHAGVVTGLGIASHYMQHESDANWQSFPMLLAKDSIRDASGVSAACLMIKKELFQKANGFDKKYRIAYNDVDLCLRIFRKLNKWNVYNANVVLSHHESISVGTPEGGTRDSTEFWKENEMMKSEWGDVLPNDPFYNKNLTKYREDFSLDI